MEPQDHGVLGPCPSDDVLLCATDGELTPDEWAIVQPHLEHCPICREKIRATGTTLKDCAQLAHLDSRARLRAGCERLADFRAAERADREAGSPRRWLAVAAILVAFVAAGTLFRGDRTAYADQILARAAQRERALAMPADLWLLKFIPGTDGQTSATRGGHGTSNSRDHTAIPAPVIRVLQERGFDLNHPLSLDRIQAWRASQPDRREDVTHRDGWLVVQSSTRGALSEVELVIDETSYQLLRQTWLIAGMGRVVCERVRLEERSGVSSREVPRAESGR